MNSPLQCILLNCFGYEKEKWKSYYSGMVGVKEFYTLTIGIIHRGEEKL
jgi:hypothetical protein